MSTLAPLYYKNFKCKADACEHSCCVGWRVELDDRTVDLYESAEGEYADELRARMCKDGDGCFMYNCPNYITEVQFYPILKKELDLLEAEMARLKELGYERQWQVEYVKYKYLKPLVEELEVQLHEESA